MVFQGGQVYKISYFPKGLIKIPYKNLHSEKIQGGTKPPLSPPREHACFMQIYETGYESVQIFLCTKINN